MRQTYDPHEPERWWLADKVADANPPELDEGHPLAGRVLVAVWRRWESSWGNVRWTWAAKWR